MKTFEIVRSGAGVGIALAAYSTDESGRIMLTAECMTGQELTHAIDELQRDIRRLQKLAAKHRNARPAELQEAAK